MKLMPLWNHGAVVVDSNAFTVTVLKNNFKILFGCIFKLFDLFLIGFLSFLLLFISLSLSLHICFCSLSLSLLRLSPSLFSVSSSSL
eukprot:m.64648 g.64648  ORF g.64648 m.64648 type:complete len:87 (-) comp11498_c0_seq4:67-327(-)